MAKATVPPAEPAAQLAASRAQIVAAEDTTVPAEAYDPAKNQHRNPLIPLEAALLVELAVVRAAVA